MASSNSNSFGGVAGVNGDLWRECVAWLTRCKVIPPDHKAAQADAEIRILAMTLRDGVLLCNLVIHLDPSSMDPREFNRKPQMAQVSQSSEICQPSCCVVRLISKICIEVIQSVPRGDQESPSKEKYAYT